MRPDNINICRIQRDLHRMGCHMTFGMRHEDGRVDAVTELKFEPIESGMVVPLDAIFQLPDELGQTMIDELWQAGFRPSQAPVGEGRAQAMTEHLKDLRALLGKQMKVKL